MRRRYLLLAGAGLLLGIGIPVLLGGRGLVPVLARIDGWHLLGFLALIGLAWNLNAGRLRVLMGGLQGRRLAQHQALGVIVATEFAISATPGGTGGPPTYAYLLHRRGLALTQALALYTVDQLMDMVFFATALVAIVTYGIWMPPIHALNGHILGLFSLLLLGLLAMPLLVRHYRPLVLFIGHLLRRFDVQPETRRRIMRRVLEYRAGLLRIRTFPAWRLAAVYGLCMGHWLLRYSILYLAVREVGGRIDWIHAFLVQMIALSVGHATVLPGGSGGAEAGATLLLLPYLDASRLAAAILLWRFATFYWYLIAGAPVFAVLAGRALWRRLTRD